MDAHAFSTALAGGSSPLPGRVIARFTGPDRVRYVNGQVSNDVARLPAGQSLHAAVCTAKGRLQAEVHVHATPDAIYVDGPAELIDTLPARLERYLIADDAQFEDLSASLHLIHAWGAARDLPVPGEIVRFLNPHRFGLDGADILASAPGAATVPAEFLDICRIAAGIPVWGRELDETTLPPEAADTRWISYTKGCYIGQETISRLKSVGHTNRLLLGVLTNDRSTPAPGSTVTCDGAEAGAVTSSAFHPIANRGLALAYIRRAHATPGAAVLVGGTPATLAALPFPSDTP